MTSTPRCVRSTPRSAWTPVRTRPWSTGAPAADAAPSLQRWRRAQVPRGERQLHPHLTYSLVVDEGAVAGVEAVDLVRVTARLQPVQVVLDLPDRAAWVVLAGEHEHRRADLLHVGDGAGVGVLVGDVGRRTAEQRTVE